MKQLLLLRHAKSSWDDPGLDDFDRPLAERGVKAARSIGRELAARGWLPDLALVSPALRTRDTWRLVAAEWPMEAPVEFVEALYEATAADILAELSKVKAATNTILLLGHNPGLEEFARRLAGSQSDGSARNRLEEKFPTAALARFTVDTDWTDLAFGGARLTHCLRPKDLR
ncbi:histidine phosphatase family protein [Mesorhizobium sp. M7A.F.Ca.CA.001.07.2.1]|uniref:SixA phosphatase family protein n=2 Tax=Phyllobacteriaceae TaxID=69277 RepID=UPI000FCB953F|nr:MULTISPECIES: histidine phosphatase family protein [Mesorhizobium]RVB17611.1 histidine phosphatase family protein [Mesorhizobium sp. M7A.F.Ca.CA.004.05.1.1]MCF6124995.1 histidine phosphatase family protein [Mesorhizobium ciceri]MCQ8813584.1 histidine phosphatase family protein [Mesorhizobium sp. SEMIA396]RUX82621.1 histidine phosphatase family protein [Mesorhizobium sp. M7A.F.Ca.CA.004.08.2.1]RUX87766.1 histidine phosphatase family protein [Mesorhizobium sp. M7A.F.Ca.CA.004.08.1.1]